MKQRSSVKAIKKAVKTSHRLPWFIASALVFSAYFALQIQFVLADTNPPQVEPPSGRAFPTFNNLETKNDVVVGQNLKVGNTIKPKSGFNLTLDADKVNFKKDLEILGSLTAGNDVVVGGAMKPKDGEKLEVKSPLTTVSGALSVAGKLFADGGLVITNGLKVLSDAKNPISLASPLLTGTATIDNLSVSGKAKIDQSLFVNGTSNLSKDVLMNKNAQVWGTFIVGNDSNYGATISSAETILKNALTVQGKTAFNEDVTVKAKLKANQIGKFTFPEGASVLVGKGANGAVSSAKCPDSATMINCIIGPPSNSDPWGPNDKLLSNAYIHGASSNWFTCFAHGSNLGQTNIRYAAHAVCFSPSEN